MNKLPNSWSQKRKAFKDEGRLEHWLFVHELITMLQSFKSDDWVEASQLGNLIIQRDDVEGFWVINLSSSEIDDYTKSTDEM